MLMQQGWVLFTSLNQTVWVGKLESLEQSSVAFSPGWTSTIEDSEREIQPETNGKEIYFWSSKTKTETNTLKGFGSFKFRFIAGY